MTDAEARKVFDAMIAEAETPEQRTTREFLREYFLNPKFREWANQTVYAHNTRPQR